MGRSACRCASTAARSTPSPSATCCASSASSTGPISFPLELRARAGAAARGPRPHRPLHHHRLAQCAWAPCRTWPCASTRRRRRRWSTPRTPSPARRSWSSPGAPTPSIHEATYAEGDARRARRALHGAAGGGDRGARRGAPPHPRPPRSPPITTPLPRLADEAQRALRRRGGDRGRVRPVPPVTIYAIRGRPGAAPAWETAAGSRASPPARSRSSSPRRRTGCADAAWPPPSAARGRLAMEFAPAVAPRALARDGDCWLVIGDRHDGREWAGLDGLVTRWMRRAGWTLQAKGCWAQVRSRERWDNRINYVLRFRKAGAHPVAAALDDAGLDAAAAVVAPREPLGRHAAGGDPAAAGGEPPSAAPSSIPSWARGRWPCWRRGRGGGGSAWSVTGAWPRWRRDGSGCVRLRTRERGSADELLIGGLGQEAR